MSDYLDRWVSAAIREEIERRFYAKIKEKARLSRLAHDAESMAAPAQHVGLFADHGVGHVRDVAAQVLTVLGTAHGVLIPQRDVRRFALMQGYAVLQTDDDITFAQTVQDALLRLAPARAGCVHVTPLLTHAQLAGRACYVTAQPIDWEPAMRATDARA